MSIVLSVSKAARMSVAFATPGLLKIQSCSEMVWSAGLFGLIYVLLLPGGVRLALKTGTVVSPVQVSQPKLPGWMPLSMLDNVSPRFAFCNVDAGKAMG